MAVAAVMAAVAVLAAGCQPEPVSPGGSGIPGAAGPGGVPPDSAEPATAPPGAGEPAVEEPGTGVPGADLPVSGTPGVDPAPPSEQPPSPPPGGPRSIAVAQVRGGPPGAGEPVTIDDAPVVAAIDDRGRLALTLWGSSSCPTVPTAFEVIGRHEVAVTLSDDYPGMCTADYGPTTSFVALDPAAVDVTSDLLVRLSGVDGLPPTVTARPL